MNDANRQMLGEALGRLPSGIAILTTRRGEHDTAMVASWVQQAAFEPPMVTLSVKSGRYIVDWIRESGVLAVNILAEGQKRMLAHFGRGFGPGEPAFDGMKVERRITGAAILADSLAYLDCRYVSSIEAGDHTLILAEIVDGRLQTTGVQPMVHIRRSGLKY
jgi:flavin reductase (DIM6/NTAB) family NADH-FMN oxidoreductase RutF